MPPGLSQLLHRSASAWPARPALALGDRVIHRHAELAREAQRLASGLIHRLGLARGDRVALVMKNVPQYVELLFACWQAGLTAVPINAKLHPRELEWIFQDTGARACFVTPELAEGVAHAARAAGAALTASHIVDVNSTDYQRLFVDEAANTRPGSGTDLAWLFYTSGTTGKPKGVMLSHDNLMAATLSYFSDVDHIGCSDALIHAAPMSHGSGLYIMPHVAQGACNVVPESGGFEPAEIFAASRDWPGLSLFAAPTMVKRLVDHAELHRPDPAGLKTVIYGGGPMYVEDIKRAVKVLGPRFAQIYGQGESPMTITAMNKTLVAAAVHDRDEARLASVGQAYLGLEVMVANEDDAPVPAGEMGEVLVRGPTVMQGYLNNPQASAKTLANGWLHTGDMGSLDADGFLTLKDRSKDLIISGGSNIYPREVEEVLLRHPAVAEVSIVGAPDPEWGEVVVAFVVTRAGQTLDTGELDELCLQNLARFKRPKHYRLIDSLPKNATGKVLKTELRRAL